MSSPKKLLLWSWGKLPLGCMSLSYLLLNALTSGGWGVWYIWLLLARCSLAVTQDSLALPASKNGWLPCLLLLRCWLKKTSQLGDEEVESVSRRKMNPSGTSQTISRTENTIDALLFDRSKRFNIRAPAFSTILASWGRWYHLESEHVIVYHACISLYEI